MMKKNQKISAKKGIEKIRLMATFENLFLLLSGEVPLPNQDTFLLTSHSMNYINTKYTKNVLDIGTGTGIFPLKMAKCGISITTIDINRPAVDLIKINSIINNVEIEALCGDLFEPVKGKKFSMIVSNPPQLPTPATSDRYHWTALANNGGRSGRDLIDRIINEAPSYLIKGGILIISQLDCNSLEETLEAMKAAGLTPRVAASDKRSMGALSFERRPLWNAHNSNCELYIVEGVWK